MRTVVFFLLISICYINGGRFRCDYEHFQSAGAWIKYHDAPATWHEARLRCQLEGATLASPLNEKLKSALLSFIPAEECGVFTGIHATFSAGDFFSVEGVPLWKIHHKWAMYEPDNQNNEENCLLMTSEGELADVNCTSSYPYLCYRKDLENMVVNECGTIDNGYTLDTRTGSCYKFHGEPRTWSRAYMTCAAEGGHLAVINSDTEAKVIIDIYARNPGNIIPGNFYKDVAFIGYRDWNQYGDWLTIHGQRIEEAGYARWAKGEPNNKTSNGGTVGQHCGGVTRGGQFDDVFCSGGYEDQLVFICEKRPDSLLCNDG